MPERIKQVPEGTAEQIEAAIAGRPATAEEARKRNQEEYTHFVAADKIYFGTALGYNAGDVVGKDVVTRKGAPVDRELVVEYGSKEHNRIREQLDLPPI
jgi:hypothetical protein